MRWLGWLKGERRSPGDRELAEWRSLWQTAADACDTTQLAALSARLEALGLPDDAIEIEREMLDGLRHLAELVEATRRTGLPAIQTGHRVVGSERCHFTAPASMPDEPAQPSGTLLLTTGKAIFAGGGGAALPWHRAGDARHLDRDLVLIRVDREHLYRFRCNSFSDALRAAFVARELMSAHRRPRL
jgi:hypothetical protein